MRATTPRVASARHRGGASTAPRDISDEVVTPACFPEFLLTERFHPKGLPTGGGFAAGPSLFPPGGTTRAQYEHRPLCHPCRWKWLEGRARGVYSRPWKRSSWLHGG